MVQLEAILRIVGMGVPLVIDEFKSILAIIKDLADPLAIVRKLAQLMREASYIVILDAFMEESDVHIFKSIASNLLSDSADEWSVISYVNGYKQRLGQKVTVHRGVG